MYKSPMYKSAGGDERGFEGGRADSLRQRARKGLGDLVFFLRLFWGCNLNSVIVVFFVTELNGDFAIHL